MSRSPKEPLRPLSEEEHQVLEQVSRSPSQPAVHMTRAKALRAVARGRSYTQAAQEAGYHVGDTVAKLVAHFNVEGVAAFQPQHAGGTPLSYGVTETNRILAEVRRVPTAGADGTVNWSLSLLKASLRQACDGLPRVSGHYC